MVIDFSKNPVNVVPVKIENEDVETVSEYKYLGTVIDDKLKGAANAKRICKKAN